MDDGDKRSFEVDESSSEADERSSEADESSSEVDELDFNSPLPPDFLQLDFKAGFFS
ncbi:hypothetical protein LC608_02730 [Nostoc sp. XA010]|uniref:hypothetical protein n=1 Tax=Nostoc sp. XA010 TaxID=2780407 RepID=UPI001E329DD8|nr:hypothetical protein [Nostoc sp. XA010]MCC5655917.1 hypothetical protein [Nostoc sp. XA010]